ncbi:MAG: carbon-nitrogen hydrolase family protein [Pseudomonadota bacterium]
MKIAAIQMVSSPDVQANLAAARQLLESAASQGAELAVLPEYFCILGFRDTDKLKIAEPFGRGPIQDFLAQCAMDLKLWIVGGTLPLTLADDPSASAEVKRVHNSTLVYDPSGQCQARYDKMHLFRFDNGRESYDESRVLQAGTQPVSFDLPSVDGNSYRIGLSICYDLRFPELYRALKADLLLVPSAFTFTTGQAHWEVLLRARAIENIAYVLASAQGGLHENGRRTWGHSMVVDPWGNILAQQAQGQALVMAEMDRAHLEADRLRLPALQHIVL